jgi:hypothetical protein
MTARAVIEQIKALPSEERAKIIDFLEEVKAAQTIGTLTPEAFESTTQRVFDRHAELMRRLSQ